MGAKCLYCGNEDLKSKRSTRKYCNDNCKQLAYYKRKGKTLSGITAENPGSSEKEEVSVKEPLTVKPVDFTVNSKTEPETVSETITPPADRVKENPTVNPEEKKIPATDLQDRSQEYEWEESRFLNSIQGFINKGYNEQYMLQHPSRYWAGDTLGVVRWITQCLLCLTESMIRLSNRRHIDSHTLFEIADAFNRLAGSYSFGFLPANYPYKNLIKELQYKMNALANANRDREKVRFRLSSSRKAQLIAARFIIGNFVPRIKFSELELPLKIEM
jgi:hypothetical protein